jgi:hypothetical protein
MIYRKRWRLTPAAPDLASPGGYAARFCQQWRDNGKELSSATHVAEAADGGWPHRGASRKPPRLVASPAAAAAPFTLHPPGTSRVLRGGTSRSQTVGRLLVLRSLDIKESIGKLIEATTEESG